MQAVMDMIRAISRAAEIKVSRGLADFLADRIVVAGTEATLLKFVERLAGLMDANLEYIAGGKLAAFMQQSVGPESIAVLAWLRQYPRLAAMIACLKDEASYNGAVEEIQIDAAHSGDLGTALNVPSYDLPVQITCLEPLSHGGDMKAGNATLFRRMQVLSTTGQVLELPFYAGNAFRGQMRDLLADHYLRSLGIVSSKSNPGVALWFFYALYSGGKLEGASTEERALAGQLGSAGTQKLDGINLLRNMIPPLSLLGAALGNRVIAGRLNFGDFRPRCRQWLNGEMDAAQLYEWTYLTRREDYEGHQAGENTSMIVNVETLRAGTVLDGGIDMSGHMTDLEKSVLARGLSLVADHGYIGADGRRGLGKARIEYQYVPAEADEYDDYLADNKTEILEYLGSIYALLG